jgi:uncharacterized protein YacL
VACLEDGTVVVLDNARRRTGRNLEVAVTNALRTSAGRMIFAQDPPREAAVAAAESAP